ncbi:MAG: endonuclease III [Verrucomicrobia bacterium]|nr:endonuclease III [Verrucomicrobiota bacterium]
MPKAQRIAEVLRVLSETYPQAHCELVFSNPLELLMATILSAQCTDVRVNQVTRKLFARCASAEDYAQILLSELEAIVQPTGFFRAKAKSLKGCAQALLERHRGEVPQSLEALVALPGVGRKTANVVLGDAFCAPEGVVVDTHVQRLSKRLGLSRHNTPEKVEADLMRLLPKAQWAKLSHWLIWHGRRRCKAVNPDCAACELQALCPSAGEGAGQIGRKAASSKRSASANKQPRRNVGGRGA